MSINQHSTLDTCHSPVSTGRFKLRPKVRLLELRNTYKWGGGPDKTILLSAEQHDRLRIEVVVAYVRDGRDHEFTIGHKGRSKGLIVYEIEERNKFDLEVLKTLQEIVLRHDINLIHSHDYKSDLFAYLLKWKLRRRPLALVSTLHGWALLGLRGYLYRILDLLVMRHFDRVIAVSHATKAEAVRAGLPSNLVSVIHNAIDTEVWSHNKGQGSIRRKLGLVNVFPIIGYVGRISTEKDLTSWLRAAALVAKRYPLARFVWVGEGRDERLLNELKELAADLGIAKNFVVLGYREDLQVLYAMFDVFFLSSVREGICNSLLEAMAMGLPVVATNAGGTKELVVNEQMGYVISPGHVEAMAEALITLICDKSSRELMGRTARAHVHEHFSFTARLRSIESLYEIVLEELAPQRTSYSLFQLTK